MNTYKVIETLRSDYSRKNIIGVTLSGHHKYLISN